MRRPILPLLALAFVSGACALVYQVAWTREFRLVFGASTRASAAVLAIFIGGLGLGARLLGDRAERSATPLRLYARLELGIALSSALTPLLLAGADRVYVATGGSPALGLGGATVVRLLLAAIVLAAPTLLMGGTLPALARAAIRGVFEVDPGRTRVGLLYGVNTLGAVAGCMATTFLLLEKLGTHATLWSACVLNALLALVALRLAGGSSGISDQATGSDENEGSPGDAPRAFVCFAAAAAGFAFFLMELVFYRMLAPILGGTVYTFGLVLAVALLGIALGGALYAVLFRRGEAHLGTLAWITVSEAMALTVPFALGDRIAVLALKIRPESATATLAAFLPGWLLVTGLVVLPVSILSGVQFPVLIGLLGRGGKEVSRDVGRAYAWNTLGAVLGAAAGGFGLMPALTAPGCWRFAGCVLFAVGGTAAALHARKDESRGVSVLLVLFGGGFLSMLLNAEGPTALWRHSGIGAGRLSRSRVEDGKAIESFARSQRTSIVWEADGIESSVGLFLGNGYAFLTNGKSDGACLSDAGTQVMGGLLGALLHGSPRSALVIGLGSGSSAGWLGDVPTMERVDAVELEPAMLEVARRCAAVNEDVLHNPKVHLTLGDAREVLSVSSARYDVVFSEPSNPYRAGVASLYTREYYARALEHMAPGGVFVQWVQAYEIDRATMRTLLATIATVFPSVEVWELEPGDLALVASREPIAKDAAVLSHRAATAPFSRALARTWGVDDVEGLLAHFVAPASFVRTVQVEGADHLNTDDRTVVEFGFARTVGGDSFDVNDLRLWAAQRGTTKADVQGAVDWARVELERAELPTSVWIDYAPSDAPPAASEPVLKRINFLRTAMALRGLPADAVTAWDEWQTSAGGEGGGDGGPVTIVEARLLAQTAVKAKEDPRREEWVNALGRRYPTEALAARALTMKPDHDEPRTDAEAEAIERFFRALRADPWVDGWYTWQALVEAQRIAETRPEWLPRMRAAVAEPFPAGGEERERVNEKLDLLQRVPRMPGCRAQLAAPETRLADEQRMLELRARCYRELGDPAQEAATMEVQRGRERQRPWAAWWWEL